MAKNPQSQQAGGGYGTNGPSTTSGSMGGLNSSGASIANPVPVDMSKVSMAAAPYIGVADGSDGSLRPQDRSILRLLYVHGPLLNGKLMQLHEEQRSCPLAFDVTPKLLSLQFITRIVHTQEEANRMPGATYHPRIQADWYLTRAGHEWCQRNCPGDTAWSPQQQPQMARPVMSNAAPLDADES